MLTFVYAVKPAPLQWRRSAAFRYEKLGDIPFDKFSVQSTHLCSIKKDDRLHL